MGEIRDIIQNELWRSHAQTEPKEPLSETDTVMVHYIKATPEKSLCAYFDMEVELFTKSTKLALKTGTSNFGLFSPGSFRAAQNVLGLRPFKIFKDRESMRKAVGQTTSRKKYSQRKSWIRCLKSWNCAKYIAKRSGDPLHMLLLENEFKLHIHYALSIDRRGVSRFRTQDRLAKLKNAPPAQRMVFR